MWSLEAFAVLTLAFLLGGLVKGVTGMGMPVVSLAILANLMGLKEAIVLIIVPAFTANIWQGLIGGRFRLLMRRLWSFFAASLAGIWLGAGILAKADAVILSGALGLLLCLYVLYVASAPRVPAPGPLEPVLSPVMGAASGVLAGMTGSFLFPGIPYLQALDLGRDGLVQAMGIAFGLAAAGLAVAFWGHGQLPAHLAVMSALAVVPAFAGMLIGQRIRGRLAETRFRQVFLAALFLLGLHLAGKAIL